MRTSGAPVTLVTMLVTLLGIGMLAADQQAEEEALRASNQWLVLVDEGQYGSSWDTSAEFFKSAITKDQWKKTLASVRTPMGRVLNRKVKSSRYATSLPGAPDGEYVVIQYETSFQNKATAVETVTSMRDPDGEWKVSGYYIK